MKKILYTGVFLIISFAVWSQQIPQISFRHQNLLLTNPASAGSSLYKEFKILHRQQWIGFENAPTSSFISYNQEVNSSNGLGGYIISDQTFPTSRFIINASYAYIIDMNDLYLSFGLAGMIMQYRFKNTDLTYRDPSDPSLAFSSDQKWRPEANAGLMIYSNKFYASFSISQILKSAFRPFSSGDAGMVQMSRHICFSGQYDFFAKKNRFSPGIFFEYANRSPFISEFSLNYSWDNTFTAAIGYRAADALNFSIGYRYSRFYLGYSFDLISSSLKLASSNSHEIMFAVDISQNSQNKPMFSTGSTGKNRYNKNNKRLF